LRDFIFFMFLGLGAGSLYALLGGALVITFKGTGVINFAQGAIAMYSTYQYSQLRLDGTIRLPWINIIPGPVRLPVGIQISSHPLGAFPAAIGALAMSVLLGVMAHFLLFRPLRNAAPLSKIVASVGLLLYLQGIVLINFGTLSRPLYSFLPNQTIDRFLWLGRSFPAQTLWIAAISIVIMVLIWLFYRATRYGLALRASAGNELGAKILGYEPNRLALVSWVLSSVVGATAGLVAGPVAGSLDPSRYTTLLVPALGAALLGRLRSIPLTLVGGLGIGVASSAVVDISTKTWFPAWLTTAAGDAVPMLVIVGVLVLRGDKLPIRGTSSAALLPRSPFPVRVKYYALGVPVAALIFGALVSGPWELALTTSAISAVLMLSYVVLTGYTGQLSLAQLTFAGVAAFVMLRLMSHGGTSPGGLTVLSGPGLPMIIAMPIAVIVAAIAGVLIGLPALRIRGVQLAVATLAFAITVNDLVFQNTSLSGLNGDTPGQLPPANLFGLNLNPVGNAGQPDRFMFTVFVIIVATICALWVVYIRRSDLGRRFLAVRANERAASAQGINVARTKLVAFAISAALAGIAGCLIAFQQSSVSPDSWTAFAGLTLLAFGYMAGITSVAGGIFAGVLAPSALSFFILSQVFPSIQSYAALIGGVGLMVNVLGLPQGIAPGYQELVARLGKKLRSRDSGQTPDESLDDRPQVIPAAAR
jgi:branched-chain amino acid transport system permease protein